MLSGFPLLSKNTKLLEAKDHTGLAQHTQAAASKTSQDHVHELKRWFPFSLMRLGC